MSGKVTDFWTRFDQRSEKRRASCSRVSIWSFGGGTQLINGSYGQLSFCDALVGLMNYRV